MVKIEIGKVMNLKRITKNNQPTKFPFVVTSEAGFGAGTPQQEHFKNAGASQKCSPGRAQHFQELKICGHGTILALSFFAAFRNFHISICSQIVDKLRLTRYYKGKSNTRQGGATMTAVIYARYSSDSQREASIEGQLRDCKDYAEKNGITVVGTYIDRAYSAKTDDRPDF